MKKWLLEPKFSPLDVFAILVVCQVVVHVMKYLEMT